MIVECLDEQNNIVFGEIESEDKIIEFVHSIIKNGCLVNCPLMNFYKYENLVFSICNSKIAYINNDWINQKDIW
jgi:hypothetical protein